jgi:hypothetical protein
MSWQIAIALLVAVPVVLLPVALVWYLNTGGVLAAIKEMRSKRLQSKIEVRNGTGK